MSVRKNPSVIVVENRWARIRERLRWERIKQTILGSALAATVLAAIILALGFGGGLELGKAQQRKIDAPALAELEARRAGASKKSTDTPLTPDACSNLEREVVKGDTLGQIALDYYGELSAYHIISRQVGSRIVEIRNPNHIEVGWTLVIPCDLFNLPHPEKIQVARKVQSKPRKVSPEKSTVQVTSQAPESGTTVEETPNAPEYVSGTFGRSVSVSFRTNDVRAEVERTPDPKSEDGSGVIASETKTSLKIIKKGVYEIRISGKEFRDVKEGPHPALLLVSKDENGNWHRKETVTIIENTADGNYAIKVVLTRDLPVQESSSVVFDHGGERFAEIGSNDLRDHATKVKEEKIPSVSKKRYGKLLATYPSQQSFGSKLLFGTLTYGVPVALGISTGGVSGVVEGTLPVLSGFIRHKIEKEQRQTAALLGLVQ